MLSLCPYLRFIEDTAVTWDGKLDSTNLRAVDVWMRRRDFVYLENPFSVLMSEKQRRIVKTFSILN